MAVDKLVDSTQLNADLTSIANAIRAKGGTSNSLLFPSGFIDAVNAIESGGSDGYVWQDANGYVHLSDEQGTQTVVEPLSVTQNGTYTATSGHAYSPVTVNVSGVGVVERSDVNFYDYDGTLLHSYTAAQINDSGFSMPSNPTHAGLTAQGWNYTLAQMKTEVATQGICDIGQMYVTDDGKTRLYCHFDEARRHPYLGICPNGTVVVDWGDGSATSTLTGTSLTTVKSADHEYASSGDYLITLTVSSGSFAFYGVSTATYILRKNDTTTNSIHRVYNNAIQRVEIGANASIGNYAFRYCTSMKSITIPSSVTSIGQYAFHCCFSLTSIVIPSGVTSLEQYTFNACYSITSLIMPNGITSIALYAFGNCYSLVSLVIPCSVTTIGAYVFNYLASLSSVTIPGISVIQSYAFYNCYSLSNITMLNGTTDIYTTAFSSCLSLTSITIPSSVTNIQANAFQNDYGLGEIHFKSNTPPTVANANAWSNIPTDCKIYVPTGTLSAYTSASNYPSSSNYTYIEE